MGRIVLMLVVLTLMIVAGCSGSGFDRQTTLVPDSVTLGYSQYRFQGDPEQHVGFDASATWVFK